MLDEVVAGLLALGVEPRSGRRVRTHKNVKRTRNILLGLALGRAGLSRASWGARR